MQITIINDCCDENAKLRQISRAGSLIKNSFANCFGVKNDLEAAGFLVDAIDAMEGKEGVILANVAPRGGKRKRWKNGTPFGFFWHKKTLIVSSIDGLALSLVKKLGVIKEFYIVDIANVLNSVKERELSNKTKERIAKSQFRSFDFLPRLAAWILDHKKIPAKKYNLDEILDMPHCVWFIDNFGNIKTSLLKKDFIVAGNTIDFKIENKIHKFRFFERLKDLPNEEIGLTIGSSGIDDERFLEIIINGDNAAKKLKIEEGAEIVVPD